MGESEAVALGDHDVGVVEESVDGGGGEGLGMISSNPDECGLVLVALGRRAWVAVGEAEHTLADAELADRD